MKKIPSLGPLERKIMDVVWEQDKQTVRQVLNKLRGSSDMAYTTVMTVMNRLVAKGFLRRTKEGKHYVYAKKLNRHAAMQQMISESINSFISRFGDEAVVAFIEEVDKLKREE